MPAVTPVALPPVVLKYVVGIDIAKATFAACLGSIDATQRLRLGKVAEFANDAAGFEALQGWVAASQAEAERPLWYVVEATGVYYEELAYYLSARQQALSVLLPNKVKHFAGSTEQKSKTDALDARLLCRLGLERQLPAWQPLTPAMRQLRSLTRERAALRTQAAQTKNRAHAYAHSYEPDPQALMRLQQRQALFEEQLWAIDTQTAALVEAMPELARKLAQLTSVPGIGLTTAITIVAETSGFALVENERQLTSYAGLDVVQRQSGNLARPTAISKRGNARLRTALYLPAVSSLRYNEQQKAFYARLRARSPNGKVGVIAVMRKLLVLCYSLWKNDQMYDPAYHPATAKAQEVAPTPVGAEATQDAPTGAPLEALI
ncbi:IS110 family RNA-guided transposase [Hymenobacter sp. HD11105]